MTVARNNPPSMTRIESPGSRRAPTGWSNSPGPRPRRPTVPTKLPLWSNTRGGPGRGITHSRMLPSRNTATGLLRRTPGPLVSPIVTNGLNVMVHCGQDRASPIKDRLWAEEPDAQPTVRNISARTDWWAGAATVQVPFARTTLDKVTLIAEKYLARSTAARCLWSVYSGLAGRRVSSAS